MLSQTPLTFSRSHKVGWMQNDASGALMRTFVSKIFTTRLRQRQKGMSMCLLSGFIYMRDMILDWFPYPHVFASPYLCKDAWGLMNPICDHLKFVAWRFVWRLS